MEQVKNTSLEEAAKEYASDYPAYNNEQAIAKYAFKRGAEWGRKAMRDMMIEDAVEGEIGYWNQTGLSILPDKSLERLGYNESTRVKIIMLPIND